MMTSILIQNGILWDGEKYQNGSVAVQNGKIAAIGNCAGFEADFIYDAKGALICPGLVDIHVHLAGVSPARFGTLPEVCAFPFGVTAAVDAGCECVSGTAQDLALKTRWFITTEIVDDHAVLVQAQALLDACPQKALGLKVYFDKGDGQATTVQPLREICDYAHQRGLQVMVHCTNPPTAMREVLECLSAGDICTHVYHGIGHTVAEDDFESFQNARRRGVILDAGIAGGVHCSFNILREALRRGLGPDTVSTDITCLSAFVRGGRYGMTMAMSILRHLGMPEKDLLRSVTSAAAAAVKQADAWGSLAVGRIADIAVLKYGDISFDITDRNGVQIKADQGYYCLLTVSSGAVVYRSDRG